MGIGETHAQEGHVRIVSLRGQEGTLLFENTMRWVRTMTPENEGEVGQEFCEWIEENLRNSLPFDTYVLVLGDTVVGTASIVPDDEDAGKKLGLEGIWIGGIYVREGHKGKGFGSMLINHMDCVLSEIAWKEHIVVNLFSSNPLAIGMYERRGFKHREGMTVLFAGKKCNVYSKTHLPTRGRSS